MLFQKTIGFAQCSAAIFKKGYPFDNACCECFFKYLKKEGTNRRSYHSLDELRISIFDYIEGYYNSRRPHGSLGMLTPNQKEDLFWNQVYDLIPGEIFLQIVSTYLTILHKTMLR